MDEDRRELLDTIARERLARIDEQRAEVLAMPASTRARKKLYKPNQQTPEEIILRAWVEGTDRGELVAKLSAITYTYSEYQRWPVEGRTESTWETVRSAGLTGFLSGEELDRIDAARRQGPEASFVHSRALNARRLASRVATEADTGSVVREVAQRQGLLLDAIEELAAMHGREVDEQCTCCGELYPCLTVKLVSSPWANDASFDESMKLS